MLENTFFAEMSSHMCSAIDIKPEVYVLCHIMMSS